MKGCSNLFQLLFTFFNVKSVKHNVVTTTFNFDFDDDFDKIISRVYIKVTRHVHYENSQL